MTQAPQPADSSGFTSRPFASTLFLCSSMDSQPAVRRPVAIKIVQRPSVLGRALALIP